MGGLVFGVNYNSVTIALITGVLFSGTYVVGNWVAQSYAGFSVAISTALFFLFGLLFHPLRRFIENLMDRLFGKARYEYLQALQDLGGQISSEQDSNAVSRIAQRLTHLVGARHGEIELLVEVHR